MTRRRHALGEIALAAALTLSTPAAAGLLLIWRGLQEGSPGWLRRALRTPWILVATLGGAALTVAAAAADDPSGVAAVGAAGMTLLVVIAGAAITRSSDQQIALRLGQPFAVAVMLIAAALVVATVVIVFTSGDRVAAWTAHPNLWGAHLAAGLAVSVGLLMRQNRVAAISVGALGVAAIAGTGSRTATLAMVVAVAWAVAATRARAGTRRRTRSVVVAATLLLCLVAIATSWTLLGVRLTAIGWWLGGTTPTNHVAASEELASGLWTLRDVTIERLPDEDGVAVHRVQSQSTDGLARIHQRIVLPSRTAATLSVEFGPEGDQAGLLAFGEPSGRLSIRRDGAVLSSPPDLEIIGVAVDALENGWTRLNATLLVPGEQAVTWRVGFAPSLSTGLRDSVRVRRPSLVWSSVPLPYVGTTARDREVALASTSARQRLQYVPVALEIARRSWLVGHGRQMTFVELADTFAPGRLSSSDRPHHAHSLVLDLLVTKGVLGVAGFGLLATAWWMAVPRSSRGVAMPLVASLFVANLGDATLFTGGPEYALVAFLLLHAGHPPGVRKAGSR